MVPMSLVKKMYGKSVLAEEVNKLLSDSVYKYIQDNKVNILGEPTVRSSYEKIEINLYSSGYGSFMLQLYRLQQEFRGRGFL